MKLNDGQRETVLNALRIAANECDDDAKRFAKDYPHSAAGFRESAQTYRAVGALIENAEEIEV